MLQLFYRDNLTRKVLTKVIIMPRWKAWVQRPVCLIKSGWKRKCFDREYLG